MHPTIELLGPRDLPAARGLLEECGLPTADLESAGPELLGLREGGRLVGLVGLERFGEVALLRSLAVRPDHRGTGLGIALADAAERRAAGLGVRELFLLTTTAERFFARRGYDRRARETAPAAIRGTSEFASVCPASAAFMARALTTRG